MSEHQKQMTPGDTCVTFEPRCQLSARFVTRRRKDAQNQSQAPLKTDISYHATCQAYFHKHASLKLRVYSI